MIRRRTRRIIDDPVRPFRMKVGVAYQVVETDGELVVRPTASARAERAGPAQCALAEPTPAPVQQRPPLGTGSLR